MSLDRLPLGSLFVRQLALRHFHRGSIFPPILKIYSAFFQLLASILATYFIAKYNKSSKMPWIDFV